MRLIELTLSCTIWFLVRRCAWLISLRSDVARPWSAYFSTRQPLCLHETQWKSETSRSSCSIRGADQVEEENTVFIPNNLDWSSHQGKLSIVEPLHAVRVCRGVLNLKTAVSTKYWRTKETSRRQDSGSVQGSED